MKATWGLETRRRSGSGMWTGSKGSAGRTALAYSTTARACCRRSQPAGRSTEKILPDVLEIGSAGHDMIVPQLREDRLAWEQPVDAVLRHGVDVEKDSILPGAARDLGEQLSELVLRDVTHRGWDHALAREEERILPGRGDRKDLVAPLSAHGIPKALRGVAG